MSIWEPAARSVVVAGVPGTEGVDCQGSSREPNQCVHVSFRLESLKPVGKLRLHTLEQELMLQVGFLLPLGDFTLAPKAFQLIERGPPKTIEDNLFFKSQTDCRCSAYVQSTFTTTSRLVLN